MLQGFQSFLSRGAAQVLGPQASVPNTLSFGEMATIVDAINREIARLGHQDVETLTQNMRVLTIAGAANQLLAKPGQGELALFLLSCVPKAAAERPPTVFIRLEAILQAKGHDAGLAELRRLIAAEPISDGYLFQLYSRAISFLHTRKIWMNADLYEALWGTLEDGADLRQKFGSLQTLAGRDFLPKAWLDRLIAMRGSVSGAEDTFQTNLQWSTLISFFLASIVEISFFAQDQASRGKSLTPQDQRVFALAKQRSSASAPTDMRPIEAARDKGRSIIVLQTHAGMRNYISAAIRTAQMPVSLIGNGHLPMGFPDDFHISTSDTGSLAFAFTKLCKLMRKGPRIVRIFPDGRQGGDLRRIEVLGKTVEIGMGGAALAYYGNSALFFASTRWTGSGFSVDFTPGPVIEPGTSRQECDQIFADFYAQGIQSIILGPPENMGLLGGFWPQVMAG